MPSPRKLSICLTQDAWDAVEDRYDQKLASRSGAVSRMVVRYDSLMYDSLPELSPSEQRMLAEAIDCNYLAGSWDADEWKATDIIDDVRDWSFEAGRGAEFVRKLELCSVAQLCALQDYIEMYLIAKSKEGGSSEDR